MKFKEKVLALTKKIPKGKVTTYKIIADKLKTKAYRAVGTALRKNKTPIIIPCHRVINSNGKIGSYKGKKNSIVPNSSSKARTKEKIKLLRKEGIRIEKNKIIDFEKKLHRF